MDETIVRDGVDYTFTAGMQRKGKTKEMAELSVVMARRNIRMADVALRCCWTRRQKACWPSMPPSRATRMRAGAA